MTTYATEHTAAATTGVVARMFAWVGLGLGVTLVTAVAAAACGAVPEASLLAWVPAFGLLVAIEPGHAARIRAWSRQRPGALVIGLATDWSDEGSRSVTWQRVAFGIAEVAAARVGRPIAHEDVPSGAAASTLPLRR